MAAGILIQAIFYTRLVVYDTDWEDVADEAEKRIANEKANMQMNDSSFASIQSFASDLNTSHYDVKNPLNNSNNSMGMRARDWARLSDGPVYKYNYNTTKYQLIKI